VNDEQQHFVEEIGVMFEQSGMPRMSGRILGWLLICDPPHQTSDQLAEGLQASKGSISTMTRLLIQVGLVEKIGLPGQRRDYFRIKPGAWSQIMRTSMGQITLFRQLAERGLDLLPDQQSDRRLRLEEMRDLYAFFEREFPVLLEHWEQERKRNTA
jgi:DNA-binding transcriptional regulator GbsR (MarR family)